MTDDDKGYCNASSTRITEFFGTGEHIETGLVKQHGKFGRLRGMPASLQQPKTINPFGRLPGRFVQLTIHNHLFRLGGQVVRSGLGLDREKTDETRHSQPRLQPRFTQQL
ncbi:MAG: hypothetical protein HY360_14320 [Verrucomicrobia bacterium]|nr:hypothetical protein [Verrucomicrobiota bacterium]